jgi:hypothetical protein
MTPAVEPCSGMIAVADGHGGILLLDFVSAIRAEGKALLLWHQKTRQHAAWFQRTRGGWLVSRQCCRIRGGQTGNDAVAGGGRRGTMWWPSICCGGQPAGMDVVAQRNLPFGWAMRHFDWDSVAFLTKQSWKTGGKLIHWFIYWCRSSGTWSSHASPARRICTRRPKDGGEKLAQSKHFLWASPFWDL